MLFTCLYVLTRWCPIYSVLLSMRGGPCSSSALQTKENAGCTGVTIQHPWLINEAIESALCQYGWLCRKMTLHKDDGELIFVLYFILIHTNCGESQFLSDLQQVETHPGQSLGNILKHVVDVSITLCWSLPIGQTILQSICLRSYMEVDDMIVCQSGR